MKLYTEEQLKKLTLAAYVAGQNNNTFIYGDEFLKLIPIELPSAIDPVNGDKDDFDLGFINGAKWMRDKLTKNTDK